MGTFSVPCQVSNIVDRSRSVDLPQVLVDTGSEYTWISEKVLEEISFAGPDLKKKTVKVDAAYVRKQLADIVKDQDLSRYIL